MSADPGAGKSVLSRSLVDIDLKSSCYFFFKNEEEDQMDIAKAVNALLHQLFTQRPWLIDHAMQDYKTEGENLALSFHKCWDILIRAATDPLAGEIICVLDALDECGEPRRYELISALNKFYKDKVASPKPSPSKLKFFFTSRPHYDLEQQFVDLTRSFLEVRLKGEKETEKIELEINNVIK